jgi:hypothetical protein
VRLWILPDITHESGGDLTVAIKEWISIISTVITAFAAIISLIYAQKGINVSNKQFLFDRRLKLYQTLLQMKNTFKENSAILQQEGKRPFSGYSDDFLFFWMCNNPYLQSVQCAKDLNGELQTQYLLKRAELVDLADSFQFLFSKLETRVAVDFIKKYVQVLDVLRRCYICTESHKKSNEQLPNHAKASGDALDKQLEEIRNKGHYYESVEEMKRALESSEWIELVMQMKKNLTLG